MVINGRLPPIFGNRDGSSALVAGGRAPSEMELLAVKFRETLRRLISNLTLCDGIDHQSAFISGEVLIGFMERVKGIEPSS